MSTIPQQSHYPENERRELRDLLPEYAETVLEVGCGRGGFGRTLRSKYGRTAQLYAIEPVEDQARAAQRRGGFDKVFRGYYPDALQLLADKCDLIVFNDVLEHMVDPWEALRAAHEHLTPNGAILAAIPNVQYAPAVVSIARGNWTYVDSGLFDRTHLRYFAKRSMVELFQSTGYEVVRICGLDHFVDRTRRIPHVLKPVVRGMATPLGNSRYLRFGVVATRS